MVPKLPLVLNGVTLAILGIREGEGDSQIVREGSETPEARVTNSLVFTVRLRQKQNKTWQCSFY